jgi:hypothetical protein
VKRLVGVLVPVAVLVLAACGSGGSDDVPVDEVSVQWAVGNASSMESLVATSDAVVVGTVTEQTEQRDVPFIAGADAPSAPVPGKPNVTMSDFPVSVFRVQVNNTVLGAVDRDLFITQAGGLYTDSDGRERRVILDEDEPLVVGETYVFFLTERSDGTFSSPPFARYVVDGRRLSAVGGWGSAAGVASLEGLATSELVAEVHSAAQ